ncbi:GATA zinc finger domain-containing protein 13-like [Condylostylus longicornis]|uniref:GATA zinc finger domain-containing protein 13-like n=1 Tax=Condylostylus longicornis TaxID=2530218 RepID=UPI00244E462D|nr:GATA zinc finger domain-containing protein 13-like [Condylostylus longicornis]XP_055372606.1 GATA zinc finger domain-containing protein 13-like [Condylostylus longicornis]XP_055372607.1 GATA zinc finger domain-containing protein 13-like [Condylostylus longicornis]XP_055372608.1 GATA zinc finger domain-containing protein 13-like [Condylostylus longicornis]XP_055372609.1 GATA zinc finger domain-containing protein 13-like [Condylostylus longicornis]
MKKSKNKLEIKMFWLKNSPSNLLILSFLLFNCHINSPISLSVVAATYNHGTSSLSFDEINNNNIGSGSNDAKISTYPLQFNNDINSNNNNNNNNNVNFNYTKYFENNNYYNNNNYNNNNYNNNNNNNDNINIQSLSDCSPDRLVVYKVVLHTYWTRNLFPKHYPDWRPQAQWTKTIGE